ARTVIRAAGPVILPYDISRLFVRKYETIGERIGFFGGADWKNSASIRRIGLGRGDCHPCHFRAGWVIPPQPSRQIPRLHPCYWIRAFRGPEGGAGNVRNPLAFAW